MEPYNKIPKKEIVTSVVNKTVTNKCIKKLSSQRQRIYSDSTLQNSPKRTNRARCVNGRQPQNRPPLEDLNTNVIRTEQTILGVTRKEKTVIFSESGEASSSNGTKVFTTSTSYTTTESTVKLNNVTFKDASQVSSNKKNEPKVKIIDKRFYSIANFEHVLCGGKFSSPIKSNFYLPSNIVIFQGIPKDVKKVVKKYTVAYRNQPTPKDNTAEYSLDIYNTEYVEDIMIYQLKFDWKYILSKDAMKCYNAHARADVVNWLMNAQEYLNQPESVLFTTVRLFDAVLGSTDVPLNMYQLVSFVTMWIVIKFETNANFPTVKKIMQLCNNAYTTEQILKLERKLLAFFGFDFNVPDILFYVNFYIAKLNNPSDLLYNSVEYILQCYILNKASSSIIPSVQAAGAVCLALNILHKVSTTWHTLCNNIGYYSSTELEDVMQIMLQQIHKVQDPTNKCRYPYEKYSAKEKQQVSIILLRKLVAS